MGILDRIGAVFRREEPEPQFPTTSMSVPDLLAPTPEDRRQWAEISQLQSHQHVDDTMASIRRTYPLIELPDDLPGAGEPRRVELAKAFGDMHERLHEEESREVAGFYVRPDHELAFRFGVDASAIPVAGRDRAVTIREMMRGEALDAELQMEHHEDFRRMLLVNPDVTRERLIDPRIDEVSYRIADFVEKGADLRKSDVTAGAFGLSEEAADKIIAGRPATVRDAVVLYSRTAIEDVMKNAPLAGNQWKRDAGEMIDEGRISLPREHVVDGRTQPLGRDDQVKLAVSLQVSHAVVLDLRNRGVDLAAPLHRREALRAEIEPVRAPSARIAAFAAQQGVGR